MKHHVGWVDHVTLFTYQYYLRIKNRIYTVKLLLQTLTKYFFFFTDHTKLTEYWVIRHRKTLMAHQ